MKMDKKILASMMVIGLVATLAGAGMYAYFSDTEESTGNVFTAGKMDLRLNDENGVTATWKSPNWSPGKTVTGEIILTNVGNVYAESLYFDFKSLVTTDGDEDESNLAKKIYVTSWEFRKDGDWTSGPGSWLMGILDADGNSDGKCSLYELVEAPGYNMFFWECPKEDLTIITDTEPIGVVNEGDIVRTPVGAPETSGVIDVWDGIKMTFEFASDAGNEYQGDAASFVLEVGIFNDASEDVHYGGEGCGHGYK